MHYDVFNGDADGIVSLLQLRLAEPRESKLITGVKRDIALLERVNVKQDNLKQDSDKQVNSQPASSVTVLDISMEKNQTALAELLAAQVEVFYVDHHRPGDIPQSEYLTALIDTDANTCTSLLVNQHLKNRYANWAVVAAFGDNMTVSAEQLASELGLSLEQQAQLKQLGIVINYNGYGSKLADLHFHPADLYQQLLSYPDPFALFAEPKSIFYQLNQAYQADLSAAQTATVLADDDQVKVVLLDDAAWARRISGVFGNDLANQAPDKAHAVLTLNPKSSAEQQDSYTVSVRAPLNNKQGADNICCQFDTGGGRAAAAGINRLSHTELERFIEVMRQYYS